MAAPRGNRFWELRSRHGRDMLFASPELLWEAACEYFEWCEDNPFTEVEQKKGNVAIPRGVELTQEVLALIINPVVEMPKMRPYTLHGLCGYLDCDTSYFRHFKSVNDESKEKSKQDIITVITRIEEVIYNQKFSGAASGFLNANIIARDLGLADKKDLTSDGEKLGFDISKLTPEQLNQLLLLQQSVESNG